MYKALTLRLDRSLRSSSSTELTREDEATTGYAGARAASGLDLLNLQIYDIDESPKGEVFLRLW